MAIKDKTLLTISASLELATGVAVIAAPNLVVRVLFSADLTPGGEAVGRVGGCGLLSLAIACWPRSTGDHSQPIKALLLYNLAAACYLGYLGITGEFGSPFLLPVAALHGALGVLFLRSAYSLRHATV